MIRRALKIFAGLLLVVVLLVAGAFAFVQTGTGQRWLEAQLVGLLSTPDGPQAEVEGLEGFLPFDMRLAHLALPDEEGIWLRLEDARFAWSPSALLGGKLLINEVSAERIEVVRPPVSGEQPPPEEPDKPFQPPELPTSLPPVELQTLKIATIELGQPVLGEEASFRLTGDLVSRDDGQTIHLDLDAKRIDEPTASLAVAIRAELGRSILSVDVHGEETGGLLQTVSGQPAAGDLRFSLAGEGPLEEWVGRLDLTAHGLLAADGTLRLGLTREPTIGLVGEVRPGKALIPADVAPLLGERINLALRVTQTEAGALALEGLQVQAAAFEMGGSARVDPEKDDLDADLKFSVPKLAALEPVAGMLLAGSLQVALTADGPPLKPQGQIRIQAFDLEAAGISGKSLNSQITFDVLKPLGEGEPAGTLKMTGGLDHLSLGPDAPNPFQAVDWEIEANAPPEGELRLDRLLIRTDVARIEGSAALDRATFEGTGELSVRAPDLRPITRAYGQEIGGAFALQLRATLAQHLETIGIEIDGALEQLADLPNGLGDVLGDKLALDARAEIAPGAAARLTSLTLAGKAVDLEGAGSLALPSNALDGSFTLNLPRLAAFEQLASSNLAGLIEANASVGGTLDAPTARLRLKGEDLAAAGQVLGRLALAVDAKDLTTTPEGTLELALDRADLDLTLETGYRLEDQTLALSDVELKGPETQLAGDLSVDLAATLIDGELTGGIGNLRALRPLTGVALGGSLSLDARLQPAEGRQRASFTLGGEDLRGPFGQLDRLQAEATIEDALGTPALDADLTLNRLVVQPDVRLEQVALRAHGSLEALSLEAELKGRAIEDVELRSAVEVALGKATEIQIARLNGRFAGEPLRLAQPARLQMDGPALSLKGLDLRYGGARLTAAADLDPEQASLEAELNDLALSLLAPFGAPELEGAARAEVQLQGAASQPGGTFTLTVSGVRPVDQTVVDAPPADLDLEGSLDGRRLQATLQLAGLTDQPVAARADVPLVLELAPFNFALPEAEPISGTVDLEAQLARIAAIIGLDDQRLEGLLRADLRFDGTLAEPALAGNVTLDDGVYENGETGTVLAEIGADIRVGNDAIRIERFSATDGGDGRLRIDGRVGLDQLVPGDVDLRLGLESATLVRRDDATATISGNVGASGNFAERLDVAGKLTVNRAVISIEENPGPSIASLDVEEVGGGTSPVAAEDQADPGPPVVIGLNVEIDIPGQVFVRGRGLESEWQGQLAANGTVDEPSLTGYLEIRRGRFDFVDKRFDIARGRIDFAGEVPPSPTLDLVARAEGANITGIISLSGPATDPKLELSSEPPLPQDEVLAQLLFDRPVNQLGPGDAIALAQTVSALKGGKSRFDLLGRARNALGVDTLEVGGGESAGDVNVRAGKYLSDDVYLEVESGTPEQAAKASVEIEVLPDLVPNLAVEAETTEDAAGGVGIKWRYDY